MTFLADALSRSDSIAIAIGMTNILQLRVIVIAAARGGATTISDLVANSGPEVERCIRAAVDGLEILGLAFWEESGNDPRVWLPPAVIAHAPMPPSVRYHLRHALSMLDATTLGNIAQNLGIAKTEATRRDTRIDAITEMLKRPDRPLQVLESLSPGAMKVFEFIRQNQFKASLYELGTALDPRHRNQLYEYGWSQHWGHGKPRNPVEELLAHALLLPAGQVAWGYGDLVVPLEVVESITGVPLLGGAPRMMPPLVTAEMPATSVQRHDVLCRDITYLFGYLDRTETGRTAKGLIYRTALKSLAKGLTTPTVEYASFVYALARAADLIDVHGRSAIYHPTRQAMSWLDEAPAFQQRVLLDAWRLGGLYNEAVHDPLADTMPSAMARDRALLRDYVVRRLVEIGKASPGALIDLESLIRQARYEHWASFGNVPIAGDDTVPLNVEPVNLEATSSVSQMRYFRRVCGESLFWLGLAEVRRDAEGNVTHVRATQRLLALSSESPLPVDADGQVDQFVLQPNMEIFAPPNLRSRVLYDLFLIAEPGAGNMLSLTRDMLRRALDRGETAKQILEFLTKHSQTGVPQNVEYLVREVGERHGHIRVGQAGIYLQVSDPVLLKELQAQRNLKISFRGSLSDTIALITGDSVEAVLKQLRQAGYFPVGADHTEKEPRLNGVAGGRPPRRPTATAMPNETDTRINWDAIQEPGEAPAGPNVTDWNNSDKSIRDKVSHAIDHESSVVVYVMDARSPAPSAFLARPLGWEDDHLILKLDGDARPYFVPLDEIVQLDLVE